MITLKLCNSKMELYLLQVFFPINDAFDKITKFGITEFHTISNKMSSAIQAMDSMVSKVLPTKYPRILLPAPPLDHSLSQNIKSTWLQIFFKVIFFSP